MCTLFILLLANATAPSPPQALIGRITLSTSLDVMQPLSLVSEFLTEYRGALLSPASTQGRNVYPIY